MKNTTNIPDTYREIKPLEDLDNWQVHEDDTDIRSYSVKTVDGKVIGEVENLLADTTDRIVRYARVKLNDSIPRVNINGVTSYTQNDGDQMVVVPMGMIDIKKSDDTISVADLTADQFSKYPRYNHRTGLNRAYENNVFRYISNDWKHPYSANFERTKNEVTGKEEDAIVFNQKFYNSPYFKKRIGRSATTNPTFTTTK